MLVKSVLGRCSIATYFILLVQKSNIIYSNQDLLNKNKPIDSDFGLISFSEKKDFLSPKAKIFYFRS